MNTETNTQPLYKVLNEKRTQGKIKFDTMPLPSRKFIRVTADGAEVAHFLQQLNRKAKVFNDKEAEANAEYAALAINNFDKIAELLEQVLDMCEYPYKEMATYKAAKEALSKIS